MDLLFILIGAGLAIFVIFVSFKSIGAGIAAKSEINRQKDKLKSDEIEKEEEILEKLKSKNLSAEDLQKMHEDLQKNKKDDL